MKSDKSFLNNIFKKENCLFISCFFIILLYFIPYILFGKDSKILIDDNLDSNVSWIKMLLDNGNVFSSPSTHINQVFNGIPRSSLYGNYEISILWFKIFGIYWGYVFNKFLMSLVGFVGMYYLLKRHFLKTDVFKILPFGIALLYSLLPFWSFTMSVAGLPLVLFAFLNLRDKKSHYSNWLIIILYPFYSSLIFSGFFFIVVIGSIFFYDLLKSNKINYNFLIGIILLCCMYVLSHYPLFYTFIYSSDFVSHRVEFHSLGLNAKGAINQMIRIFILGQHHAHSLHTFIIFPIVFGLYLNVKTKIKNKRYLLIFIFIIATSIFYGMLEWNIITPFKNQLMSFIPLQLQRFHWLHPMFWYVLFGMSLVLISKHLRFGFQIASIILLFQFIIVLGFHEIIQNRKGPTFRQFYAEDQFKEIKTYIGKPQKSYRVISLGIHPSIAQFNGFYTLDGYISNYSLQYKHKFRRIIENELQKDSISKDYFDNWGSRCYAFSSELGQDFQNPNQSKIEHLEFNFNALKEMGGEYIFSKVEINTNYNKSIKLLRTFENTQSYWKIYLYKVL